MECSVTASDIPVPTATDNCTGQITATTSDPLDYSAQGTYTITWNYNDGNGNASSQTQTVIVDASSLDQVEFNDETLTYDGNLHTIEVNNLPANAAVSYSISPNTGTDNGAIDAGVYTVTAELTPPASAVNCSPVSLSATLTIEKAPQTITFEPIPLKHLEDDPDFQLMATASSGLPVNYTFTFTTANPPATVSTDGFVNMLTSGTVEITVHQDGNTNYLPAGPVEQTLEIDSRDVNLVNINIAGQDYENPISEVDYTISCGDSTDEVDVTITTGEPNVTVEPGLQFTIATPKPGIYTQEVTVTSQDGTTVKTYLVRVEKRFAFDDIVVQKFDNVLLVNNNPDTNGGYKFKAYKWYKNGHLIGKEQYYSAGDKINQLLDPNAEYYVEMTTVDGDVLRTCASEVVLEHDYAMTLSPNPVPKTMRVLQVDADFPIGELKNMGYTIYSLSGRTIVKASFDYRSKKINLPVNIASGVYLVRFTSPHFTKTYKVIVQ